MEIIVALIGFGGAIVAAYFGYWLIKRDREKNKAQELQKPQHSPPIPPVTSLPEAIPKLPAPYFAHPYPMQKNFTGRMAERKELTEWFTKKTEPMFTYIAIGGMGKSALTWFWQRAKRHWEEANDFDNQ